MTALLDEETFRILLALGDLAGLHCLEVGAGTGTVAAWLSRQVGPSGSVLALDIDVSHLSGLPPSVEVRQHDITADDLPGSSFELVHCRALLVHLPDPSAGLQRMAQAVAPQGWLVVEEPDQTAFGSADPLHPAAATFDRVMHEMLGALKASRRSNQYFGRLVPALMRHLGFVDLSNELTASIEVGGSDFARMLRTGAFDLWTAVGPTIDVRAADFEVAASALQDPEFSFVRMPMVRAWARRAT